MSWHMLITTVQEMETTMITYAFIAWDSSDMDEYVCACVSESVRD